jgi:homocysteine S-methyltransferase
VDLFVFETFTVLDHLLVAIGEASAAAADVPVMASVTLGEELVLPDGTGPAAVAAALRSAGVDVIGVNCGGGPLANLEGLEALAQADAAAPRSIMPNAGLPQRLDGRFIYAATPAYLGEMVPRFVAAGAAIVGGCCGTTPEHTVAMRAALEAMDAVRRDDGEPAATLVAGPAVRPALRPARSPGPSVDAPRQAPDGGSPAIDTAVPAPTGLARALAAGRFVVSVEIDPPRSIRIERTLDAARLLRDAGVDLINVSDSAMARVRMGALAVAFAVEREVGVETLVHFTTRDRNLMAIESELLGAHALGIRNILALTGDPPRVADYPTGTGVWDVDSIGLIEILTRLDRGEDAAGSPIGQPAGFTIACALDPTAADQATEWERLERKLAAGAHLVMTQPLYSVAQVEAMDAEARRRFGSAGIPVPVLLGLLPLQSSRHAEFLHHEVPGITIPDETRAAMAAAGDGGVAVGLHQALELLTAVRHLVAGTYLMPSFGRYEQCADLVRSIQASASPQQPTAAHTGAPAS